MRVGALGRVVAHIQDASNSDIVGLVTRAARDPVPVVSWPPEFDTNDAPRLCWDLLRSLQYVADEDAQVVKSPRVLLADGVGDCKSFAVFAVKTLRAAGWNAWLRFVKNEPGAHFGHVYAVCERDGEQVIVDGVLDQFDREPLHFGSLDVLLQ